MSRVRSTVGVFVLFLAHVTVFAHVHPFGVAPDVMLLGAMVGAMSGNENFGAKHGFACGLLVDLMSPGPFGLAAGVYGSVAYGVAIISQTFDAQDPRVGPITTTIGSFVATVGYGLGLGVLGAEQFVNSHLFVVAGLVSLYNLILSPLVRRLYRWVLTSETTYARARQGESVKS